MDRQCAKGELDPDHTSMHGCHVSDAPVDMRLSMIYTQHV
jgi:hypothetical protein